MNCLQGGKLIGSKCKIFKYTIINKNNKSNTINVDPFLAYNILLNIRKTIVSGKGG